MLKSASLLAAGCFAMLISTGCTSPTSRTTADSDNPTPSKAATHYTIKHNQRVLESLNFRDDDDFIQAAKGFIAKPDTLTIYSYSPCNKNKTVQQNPNVSTDDPCNRKTPVWDLEEYKTYISDDKPAPDTVNPSLWRNAQLNMYYGLFKVTDGIYQVRGYDLSNITFVRGKTGWIVFDPLISPETAKAALRLINKEVERLPVVALIYSHSHLDHYGGAKGLFHSEEEMKNARVLAPEGFTEHAVSENVIAGNAMGRRAIYMYGSMLPRNERGGVNGGLGMTTSTGVATLLLPTEYVSKTAKPYIVDGVLMEFQMTPGTEAPAEMNTWFPRKKALWMAENTTNTMHNILTLRGALVRDALVWSQYLTETIETWGDKAEVKFQSHHWPLWGSDKIVSYLKKQRDIYKFTHDQTVRLMNQGYTGEEISEMLTLPESLELNWATRGYYGTLRHNSRAVYQRYMGWYDGNPANLNNLPPEKVARHYIRFMGGEEETIRKARASYKLGEYRWVAEVMKHAVFANPDSYESKELLADALEQLGYQAESGPWRSVYLQGAFELRNPIPTSGGLQTATPDTVAAMSPEMILDYMSVRLNGDRASGKNIGINLILTPNGSEEGKSQKANGESNIEYGITIENAVLNYGQLLGSPDVTLTMEQSTLNKLLLEERGLLKAIMNQDVTVEGEHSAQVLAQFTQLFDDYNFWFPIVTP